jgi:catechol 2,3-dioxygenase-like lactoylglutathione lyase family enzyme
MSTVSVRYIVHDVDAAIDFYRGHLDFHLDMHPDPAFAMLSRGDLRLVVVSPIPADHRGAGSRPMPDGRKQEPGGWNRFMLEVTDLAAAVERLRGEGVSFRNDIVTGVGGRQVMIEDPSGNPVELFQPLRQEARLSPGPAGA